MSTGSTKPLRRRLGLPSLQHPAQVVVAGFALAIVVGWLLLLPVSRAGEDGAPPIAALFTAASAVCVTGMVVVDTPTYWSGFGQAVILGLIEVGGLGIMTVGIKSAGEDFTHATPESVVEEGDLIIVSRPETGVERFSNLVQRVPG